MGTYHRGSCLARALTIALVALAPAAPRAYRQAPSPEQAASAVPVEVVVLDHAGKVADDVSPASFAVTVDGKPRSVRWARYVSRGPGSTGDALQRARRRTGTLGFAAEPARSVLVIVDETSLQRGSERTVLQAASALVDRFGLDDRIGVLRVPTARDSTLTLTTVRPEVREALRRVTGQAVPAGAGESAQPQAADAGRAAGDPGQAAAAERERTPAEAPAPARAAGDPSAPTPGLVESLQSLLTALESSPGRKAILIFSGGMMPAGSPGVDEMAVAASAAHAVVYAFGIQGVYDDPSTAPDLLALERLAKSTGGSYLVLGKNPERTVERVMSELSACYVLGIESVPSDTDGKRHALRVETPRQPLAVRAPAWLVPKADLADLVPAAPASAAEPSAEAAPVPANASVAPPPRVVPFARDPEIQRILARASDYIVGYQREYSLLVAEENYVQTTRTERQQVRSDVLLVRTPDAGGWVSFRDVFEVNGRPVRDRDDRLKRLFLDQSAEAQAQLKAIKEESARYNIGQVVRNINVPLFPLKFLEPDNLLHFDYKSAGRQDVAGVEAARVAYVEWARPTLVRYNEDKDIPASGWFLVDPVSGAIVGTRMEMASEPDRIAFDIEVRYQRDASLGLWVPAEMKETYAIARVGTMDRTVTLEGRATYSKFRRFQVKVEEQIKIPK
jgi:VWFA-related protein